MKILPLLLISLISLENYSQTKNFIDQPYIETSATVDTLVVPNKIYLNIIISENDTKNKVSVEKMEVLMEKKLLELGIDTKKNLTLNDFASNFKNYFLKKKEVNKTKTYTLVVEKAKLAGKVIAELEAIEISNIRVDKTENTEYEKILLVLKSKAVAKAKKQAEFMVKPLGQKVGAALLISDFVFTSKGKNAHTTYGYGLNISNSLTESVEESIDIEFDKIKITNSVDIKFRLE